jgi:hypothetical protein
MHGQNTLWATGSTSQLHINRIAARQALDARQCRQDRTYRIQLAGEYDDNSIVTIVR